MNYGLGGGGYYPTSNAGPRRSGTSTVSMACSLVLVLLLGAGAWYYLQGGSTPGKRKASAAVAEPVVVAQAAPLAPNPILSSSGTGVARGLDGRYQLTYGGESMTSDPRNCQTTAVWFDDVKDGSQSQWNLKTVPGYEDVYYVRNEDRFFNQGCAKAYLQAPSSCAGPAYLSEPSNTDLQYWQLLPSIDGGYELRNVSCNSKKWPAYVISSATQKGPTNTARLVPREGAPYTLRRV